MTIGQLPGHGRAVIFWAIAFFLVAQFSLTTVIERWRPEWRDPEYGERLRRLSQQIKEQPDRPLLLILGSSRTGGGFEADRLPPASWTRNRPPIVFNMSMAGGTLTYELMILKRLLAAGIRPSATVIEVLPPFLNGESTALAIKDFPLPPNRLRWSDLPILDRYAPQFSWYRYCYWLESYLAPWYSSRFPLLSRYAPSLVEPAKAAFWRQPISPHNWTSAQDVSVTPQQQQKLFRIAHNDYSPLMLNFRIAPKADQLLREILDTCRQNNISVVGLLRMPEGTDFRKLYPPEANRIINSYLKGLCQQYGIRWTDASTWVNDDDFLDSHHLLRPGAEKFTLRYWKEVLQPWLEAQSHGG